MIIDVDREIARLKDKILDKFGERIIFIGIQGSYARGTATESSDIDLVVIFNTLAVADLAAYRSIVKGLPFADRMCGFVSGKGELAAWPRSDLFQFCRDTKALYGTLGEIASLVSGEDVINAVRIGAANLYHMSCHSYLFENAFENLPTLYKAVFFIMQAKCFIESGEYLRDAESMMERVSENDAALLQIYVDRTDLNAELLDEYYGKLIKWSGDLIGYREG